MACNDESNQEAADITVFETRRLLPDALVGRVVNQWSRPLALVFGVALHGLMKTEFRLSESPCWLTQGFALTLTHLPQPGADAHLGLLARLEQSE